MTACLAGARRRGYLRVYKDNNNNKIVNALERQFVRNQNIYEVALWKKEEEQELVSPDEKVESSVKLWN